MAFTYSAKDKRELQEALQRNVPKRIALKKLHALYSEWAESAGMVPASRQAMRGWMNHDFEAVPDPIWGRQGAAAFHAFLKAHPEFSARGGGSSSLVHILENHFHTDHTIPHDYLNSLCGEPFAMFRRLWSKPESGLFLRTIVTITHDDGVFLYEEKEDFFDPVKSIQRYEIHNGPVLIFGYNLYILARGNDGVHCLKFLAIHDSDPLINGKTKTAICRGNMIAVTGRGPHPGFKFVLKRIAEGEDEGSRVVEANALDDDTRNYLTG